MTVENLHKLKSHFVYLFGSQAAAKGEHDEVLLIKTQFFTCFLFGKGKKAFAHRISRFHAFFRIFEIICRIFKSEKNSVHVLFQCSVCKSRISILLMEKGFGAVHLCGQNYRKTYISSCTYHYIRLELSYYLSRFQDALGHPYAGSHQLPEAGFVKPPGIYQCKLITRFGHHILFYALIVSYVQNLGFRIHFPEFVGDGNGRIYMPARSSAGYNHSHKSAVSLSVKSGHSR